MFIRYENGSVMMVTGVEIPAYFPLGGGLGVVVGLGWRKETYHFPGDELAAWRFFDRVNMQIGSHQVFTLKEWNKFKEWQKDERCRDMRDIKTCVICGKPLAYPREQVDTCGKRCERILLKRQRDAAFGVDRGINTVKSTESNGNDTKGVG